MNSSETFHAGLLPEWTTFEHQYISRGIPHRFVVRPEPAVYLFVDEHGARFGALLAMPVGTVPGTPLEEISVKDVRLKGERYLEISTTHKSLYRNFFFFLSDIVAAAIEGSDPQNAFAASVIRWNALLQNSTLLGEERQRGLFGELWMLRRLLNSMGLPALDAWTGPMGEAHDFRLETREFEVKTTSRAERVHIINGSSQLEPSPNSELFILSLQLAEAGAGGETLPDLVRQILEMMKASADSSERFLMIVKKLGFDWSKQGKYPSRRKLRAPPILIPVVEGCPRIVPSVIAGLPLIFAPARIGKITYEIDVSGMGFEDGAPSFLEILP